MWLQCQIVGMHHILVHVLDKPPSILINVEVTHCDDSADRTSHADASWQCGVTAYNCMKFSLQLSWRTAFLSMKSIAIAIWLILEVLEVGSFRHGVYQKQCSTGTHHLLKSTKGQKTDRQRGFVTVCCTQRGTTHSWFLQWIHPLFWQKEHSSIYTRNERASNAFWHLSVQTKVRSFCCRRKSGVPIHKNPFPHFL